MTSNDKYTEWKELQAEYSEVKQRVAELLSPHSELGSAVRQHIAMLAEAQKTVAANLVAFDQKYQLGAVIKKIQQAHFDLSNQAANFIRLTETKLPRFDAIDWSKAYGIDFPKLAIQFQTVFEQYREHIRGIAEQFNSQRFTLGETINRALERVPDNIRAALIILGRHGWFVDAEMSYPQLIELAENLLDGKVQEVDEALLVYYEGRLEAIVTKVTKLVPTRVTAIRGAFEDYRAGKYISSIPLILIHADGICIDITKYSFFQRTSLPNTKKRNIPQTAKYVEQLEPGSMRSISLEPLKHVLPLNKNTEERKQGDNGELNRHAVLHGESVSYDTRLNAIKAVSFLNYILDHVVEEAQHEASASPVP